MDLIIAKGGRELILVADDDSCTAVELERHYPLGDGVHVVQIQRAGKYGIMAIIKGPRSPGSLKWRPVQTAHLGTLDERQLTLDPRQPIDPVTTFVSEHLKPLFADQRRAIIVTHDDPRWTWYDQWNTPQVHMLSDGSCSETNGPRKDTDPIYGDEGFEMVETRTFLVGLATWAIIYADQPDGSRKFQRMHVGPGVEEHLDEVLAALATMTL